MLCQGRLVRQGTPDEAITRESLRLAYGVDVDVMVLARDGHAPTRVCVPALPRHSP
jgi:ABC-type cobalamin/Fe3+-siderophores transport system ATPase subunit